MYVCAPYEWLKEARRGHMTLQNSIGCELGIAPHPLEEQPGPLTTEPALQPNYFHDSREA